MAWTKTEFKRLARKRWRLANPAKEKARIKRWKNNNPLKAKAIQTRYNDKSPEANRRKAKKWRQNNGPMRALTQMKRHASKMQRTPGWLTNAQIQNMLKIYKAANGLTKLTGVQFEVDHIIPLQGANVSGLHVPWNLQILTASENSKKSNKFSFTAP